MKRMHPFLLCVVCGLLFAGCGSQPSSQNRTRGDTTREVVAKATRTMKPELQWSARKLAAAVEWAADESLAAVQGFFQGWFAPQPLNVNRASERQLRSLPGISAADAQRIVRARPYRDKRELLKKGVITEAAYARIKDDIAAD